MRSATAQRFEVDGLADADDVDLVVVGAGISGLAAAWFYRRDASRRDDPAARQPRRLRRARQAQRVHGRRPVPARLRRERGAAVPRGALRPRGEGAARGARRRPPSVRALLRHRPLSLAGSVARPVLHEGGLRRRQAGGRGSDADGRRRHPGGPDARADARGLHRGLPAARGVAACTGRPVHIGARPDAVARRRRQARRAVADQLPRLRPAVLGPRRPRGRHVPGTIARFLRDRHRRHHGVRRDGDGLPGVRRACDSRRTRARSPRWRSRTSITSPTGTRR